MSETRTIALPASAADAAAPPVRRALVRSHLDLCKARLTAMVVFTTALGFVVGSKLLYPPQFDWLRLIGTCLGTFIAAAGASALNQAIEARRDARMPRTFRRPVPQGRLSRTYAATFGLIACITGVAILCPTSNGLAAVLATANILIYVAVYTPLKPVTAANTLVGAVVGGVPPMIGWAAATGSLSAGAWVLGGILFVWQIPHFLALCWMYREEYGRAGFKMLPTVEPSGRLTGQLALVYSVALLPLCLLVVHLGHAGWAFAAIAAVLTCGLAAMALRFARRRSAADARRLFFASIIYLPLLVVTLMADARGPLDGLRHGSAGYSSPPTEQFIDPGSVQLTN